MDENNSNDSEKEKEESSSDEYDENDEYIKETESNLNEQIREASIALRLLYEILVRGDKELVGLDRTFVEESITSIERRMDLLKSDLLAVCANGCGAPGVSSRGTAR